MTSLLSHKWAASVRVGDVESIAVYSDTHLDCWYEIAEFPHLQAIAEKVIAGEVPADPTWEGFLCPEGIFRTREEALRMWRGQFPHLIRKCYAAEDQALSEMLF